MSMKSRKTNYRVEVTPDVMYWGHIPPESHDSDCVAACEEIVSQIKRHIDCRSAAILFDTEKTCEYCGYAWTEESPDYNGGCCDKDEANNPNPEPEQ